MKGQRSRTHDGRGGSRARRGFGDHLLVMKSWMDFSELKYSTKQEMMAACGRLTLESPLLSDMLEEESGLPGGEESTCKGPSSSSLTSEGVCNSAALKYPNRNRR